MSSIAVDPRASARENRGLVPASERERLRRVQPGRFVMKLALMAALLALAGTMIVRSDGVVRLLFQVMLGAMIAHGVELVHQCLHGTGTGRRNVDHALGRILSWPAGVSYWYYLYWHHWHHANNGTEEDAESFGYTYELLMAPSRSTRLLGFAWHVSQLAHYRTAFVRMALAVAGRLDPRLEAETPAMPAHVRRRIQHDYQVMALLLVSAVAASAALRSTLVLELWLVPLLVGYGPFHALIELPEHFLCARPTGDVFENTRSIRAGWFGRWLTNNNGNHVGHHYDPLVPLEKVPQLESLLMNSRPFDHYEETYPRYYWDVARFLWTGERPEPAAPRVVAAPTA